MEWIDIAKQRPPHGEKIWVWDNQKREKFVIVYLASEESWQDAKHKMDFPLWAYIN